MAMSKRKAILYALEQERVKYNAATSRASKELVFIEIEAIIHLSIMLGYRVNYLFLDDTNDRLLDFYVTRIYGG